MNQWELDEMVKNAEREDAEKRKLNHDWVVVRLKPWQSVEDVKNDIECIQCGNANVRVYVGNIPLLLAPGKCIGMMRTVLINTQPFHCLFCCIQIRMLMDLVTGRSLPHRGCL